MIYFGENTEKKLKNHNYRIVTVIRLKIILISYLISLPDYFGVPGWTPFLNFNLVKHILSIKDEKWTNRLWLTEFFKEKGIYIEENNLKYDSDNCLEYEGLKVNQIKTIKASIFEDYLDHGFINSLIHNYSRLVKTAQEKKDPFNLKFKKLFYLLQRSPYYFMKWYTYLTILKSIEMSLKK